MNYEFLQTLFLTLELAFITTLLLLAIGIPIGYFLAYSKFRLKPVVETIVSMPLVLPPTVLGFYLLVAFGKESFLGRLLNDIFGLQLVFSFEGLVLGSVIYSFPFMIHPIQTGFQNIPKILSEASYMLGKTKLQTLFYVLLPNIKTSLLTGIVISFAHTIGEFGVVLMIGGNIPGKTKVASIAIYDEVEALNYAAANTYAMVLFIITFFILLAVYIFNNKMLKTVDL